MPEGGSIGMNCAEMCLTASKSKYGLSTANVPISAMTSSYQSITFIARNCNKTQLQYSRELKCFELGVGVTFLVKDESPKLYMKAYLKLYSN